MNSNRYIRQTTLNGFGIANQEKLLLAKVLVIGAGGLGVPVLHYLNAMGVGTLGIVDDDIVALSNLQRQVLYTEADIDKPKAIVAAAKLSAQNSETTIQVFQERIDANNAVQIISNFDIIVDATDNFDTRYLVNDVCVVLQKPLVYGALHAFEGQVSVFNYKNGPTYRCLFPVPPKPTEIPDCNVNGVLGVIPGIIGNFQALEVIKIITGIGNVLSGKLLLYDGLSQSIQKISFTLQPEHLKVQLPTATLQNNEITATAFSTLLLSKSEVKVIDVRSTLEVMQDPLMAENILIQHIPLQQLDTFVDIFKNTSTAFYFLCQSGIRSQKAIAWLKSNGIQGNFVNIVGGMNAYVKAQNNIKHE